MTEKSIIAQTIYLNEKKEREGSNVFTTECHSSSSRLLIAVKASQSSSLMAGKKREGLKEGEKVSCVCTDGRDIP